MWKAYYRKFRDCAILRIGKSGYDFVKNRKYLLKRCIISICYKLKEKAQKSMTKGTSG
jgi:hypothetical protein